MWYHVKIRNKKPKFSFLNRDAALSCVARVEFLDKSTLKPLPVGQIESKWSRRPEPRNYSDGKFDIGRVPACQRLDVGFGAEMFDVVMKCRRRKGVFATDPWIVYDVDLHPDPRSEPNRTTSYHEEWEKLRIDVDECVLRIEIEAINLGKAQEAYYRLRNAGTEFGSLTIEKMEEEASIIQSRLNSREASTLTFSTVASSASLLLFGLAAQPNFPIASYPLLFLVGILFPVLGFLYRELTIHTVDKNDYDRLPSQFRTNRTIWSSLRGYIVRFFLLSPIFAWAQLPTANGVDWNYVLPYMALGVILVIALLSQAIEPKVAH